MAMFDCSQVYLPPPSEVHVRPDFSPKSISHPPFVPPQSPSQQTKRASLSPSEPASTTFGSDNDKVFSSGDEDSLEFQSDTAHDSVASRAAMSHKSHPSRPEIQKFFSEPSSPPTATSSAAFNVPTSPYSPAGQQAAHPEQPGSRHPALTPTASRSADCDGQNHPAPIADQSPGHHAAPIPSSPPLSPNDAFPPFQWEHPPSPPVPSTAQDTSFDDPASWAQDVKFAARRPQDQSLSPQLPNQPSDRSSHHDPGRMLCRALREQIDMDSSAQPRRLSIFDWSEQPRSERESLYGSSPRPRTMHSKPGNEARVGRPVACRAPNALHLRSQSVPVAKESPVDTTLTQLPAKFGTWGLGNKGVSEEWNDDFDFGETEPYPASDTLEKFAAAMTVPQAIIDRQASVHGQFGLVQEFMSLVEELKRLRHQGNMLDLLRGSHQALWEDAENIINLATLNDDDDDNDAAAADFVGRSPRGSGTFDEFDELSSPLYSPRYLPRVSFEDDPLPPPAAASTATPPAGIPARGRGESLAQAKSFLQTMHQNRRGREAPSNPDSSHPPKLPFDTQDLRDLVARTNLVKRSLKDVVRTAEGVVVSPNQGSRKSEDPPFRRIFNRPESPSPAGPTFDPLLGHKEASAIDNSAVDGRGDDQPTKLWCPTGESGTRLLDAED